MNTTNAASFFQSADAQEKLERQAAKSSNSLGSPIRLSTKLLHVTNDLDDSDCVLLAESGSIARRVNHVTEATVAIYRGHTAPVTQVIDLGDGRVATGSWDKTIRVFDKHTKDCLAILSGHTDFVKCLLHLPEHNLLLSGSSDTHIRAWSLSSYTALFTLKGHARGVESLTRGPGYIYSGGSESSIRKWQITSDGGKEIGDPSWLHETSIYALRWDNDSESLYTASADKSARQLVVEHDILREDANFEHPDYVRDVILFNDWVVTACRDEDIRIWQLGNGKCLYTLQGHYSEVSSLCIIGNTLISCSLDATVRKWTLTHDGLAAHVHEQAAWKPEVEVKVEAEIGMTAEELAELEDLMADD